MKISVIVPVYNSEAYLEKCLNSLKDQTLNNIEVILIDDGSTDSSGRICDEFARNDSRFVVVHKKNEGVCAARNQGLEIATGDYIGFVDSDDYCAKGMYMYLARLAEKNKADIACCGIKRTYLNTGATFYTRRFEKINIYNQEEALERFFLPDYITTAVWNKIFRIDVLKGVKFPNYARNDDGWFVSMAFLKSSRIAVGEKCLYRYQIRQNSITRGNFSEKSYDILNSVDDIYNKVHAVYPNNKNMILAKVFWYIVFSDEMIIAGKKDKEVVLKTKKLIRNNIFAIIRCKEFGSLRKFQFYLYAISYRCYSLCYLFYSKCWGKN